MTIAAAISRIRAYRRHKDWTISRMAKEGGLHESTIRRIDDPAWNPTRHVLERLEAMIPADYQPEIHLQPLASATGEAA